ncbi:VOC family protein [bacterium]|nr:VOC family protein [bacterium]
MTKAVLDHIAIAATDLSKIKKLFLILGLGVDHVEDVPEQGVRTHFIPLPKEQAQIEILEVTDPTGTVSKFIQKRGPGIHHLSFSLPQGELDTMSDKLRNQGFRLVYEEPKLGAHQMRVNFVHPESTGGFLVELAEKG